MRDGFRRLSIVTVGVAFLLGLAAVPSSAVAVVEPVRDTLTATFDDTRAAVTKGVDAVVQSAPGRAVTRAPVFAFLTLAAVLALALLFRGQSEVGLVRVRVDRERRAGPRAPPK